MKQRRNAKKDEEIISKYFFVIQGDKNTVKEALHIEKRRRPVRRQRSSTEKDEEILRFRLYHRESLDKQSSLTS